LGYIFVAGSIGLTSTTVTQLALKCPDFNDNPKHYAVEDHSRSPILAPMESPNATFLCVNNSALFQDTVYYWPNIYPREWVPLFKALIGG